MTFFERPALDEWMREADELLATSLMELVEEGAAQDRSDQSDPPS